MKLKTPIDNYFRLNIMNTELRWKSSDDTYELLMRRGLNFFYLSPKKLPFTP